MKNDGLIFKTSLYSVISVLVILYLLYLLFYKVLKKHLIKETIVEITDKDYLLQVIVDMVKNKGNVLNKDTWEFLKKIINYK